MTKYKIKFTKITVAFIFSVIFLGEFMSLEASKSKNVLLDYQTKKLKNGLEIVAIPMNNDSDVISVNVFYKVGSRNEKMGKTGLAHMLEHMNFKSTKSLDAGEFDKIVKSMGGVNNASTGFDYTHYFVKTTNKNLDKSLELYAEIMQNLNLKDDEFQPERDVVLEERYWRTDNNPYGLVYFTLFNTAFVASSYHWTPIGFTDDIKTWTIEDLQNFHKKYYSPSNAIVLISGDISSEKIFDSVEKHFSKLENRADISEQRFLQEPPQLGEKRAVIYKESAVEILALGFKIPNFEHEDQATLSFISEILSDGKSSRLYKNLIDEKQLANGVYAYNMESIDENLFIFIAIGNPNVTAEELEKEIWNEIENLKNSKITTKEINKVKSSVKSDLIYKLDSSMEVANLYGEFFAKGNIEPLFSFEEKISQINSEAVQEVAKKYFTKKRSTTIILKNQGEN
jgi:predicted Zn-dependent peptidase